MTATIKPPAHAVVSKYSGRGLSSPALKGDFATTNNNTKYTTRWARFIKLAVRSVHKVKLAVFNSPVSF